MPTICNFYGITIRMHFIENEHNPPHVHASMQDYAAAFAIRDGELLNGSFPRKGREMVKEFILMNQQQLEEMWRSQIFIKLPPLE